MKNEIGIFGSGLIIGALGFPYFALTVFLSILYKPTFNIPFISADTLFIIGIIFVIVGESVNAASAAKMTAAFTNKELVKEGPYSICANPMYGSQILLSAPGIALMLNSWLVLTTAIVGIILVKLFIVREEEYLREQFGEEYDEYKRKVLIKFI
jgi:protein-S-isoprenylcysteine O-methyltransferase Ste14